MQSEKTIRLNAYLRPDRVSADRVIMARLRADRSRGVAYSQTIKLALTHYYERPSPVPTPAPELAELAAAINGLVAQVAALQAQVTQLATENAELKQALALSAFGDRQGKQRAAGQAAKMLAGNGNGNGNHDR